ncbi:cysteine hydrolase family protein [Aquimarina rhabdastrellae]
MNTNTALIVIDLQNDYYEGGKNTLSEVDAATQNARLLLDKFRADQLPIFHVQHVFASDEAPFFCPNTSGSEIHPKVQPLEGEKLIVKQYVNAFKDTTLLNDLRIAGIQNLIICGAMSHMCVAGTTRAASDLGFNCTVIEDACATLDQEFDGMTVPATHVHATAMATLAFAYAKITTTKDFLS